MNRIELVRQQVDAILLAMSDAEERRCGYVHLYGVAQTCAFLAKKRGENAELAVIAGMLHDIYSYANMDSTDHAHKGAALARKILESLKVFSEEEVETVCTAIYRHSDKEVEHNALDEILKDADVLQHVWYNPLFEVKQAEQERYERLVSELGV
ncbi:MAG: HD domain-containing protein [Lachnospiraceae bacterium]|nr:HD domain-containing protein [Lachnospiraceae bacterium]